MFTRPWMIPKIENYRNAKFVITVVTASCHHSDNLGDDNVGVMTIPSFSAMTYHTYLTNIIWYHGTIYDNLIYSTTVNILSKLSVESPSMVDPQWNIWYWGSKWNLHRSAEVRLAVSGAQPLFTLGLLMFALSLVDFIVFAVEPQYLLQNFLFLSKVSFELHIQNLQKMSCWFKIWMGFVGPILIKLWTSSIWGFI